MSLFLLVDLPLELAVDTVHLIFALILQAVLEHTGKVVEQSDRAHCSRPVFIVLYAVQELLGVLVAMFGSRGQIEGGFLVVTLDLSSVEVKLSELIFGVVVAVLRGDLEVLDGTEDVLDILLGEQ